MLPTHYIHQPFIEQSHVCLLQSHFKCACACSLSGSEAATTLPLNFKNIIFILCSDWLVQSINDVLWAKVYMVCCNLAHVLPCPLCLLIVRAHRHGVSSLFSNRLQSSTEAAPLSWHSSRSPTTVLTHFRYDYLGENVEIRDVDIATHTSSERQQRKLF